MLRRTWFLIIVVALSLCLSSCKSMSGVTDQLGENAKQVEFNAGFNVTGLSISGGNYPDRGLDFDINFDMDQFLTVLKTLFWNIPIDLFSFFGDGVDEVTDTVVEPTAMIESDQERRVAMWRLTEPPELTTIPLRPVAHYKLVNDDATLSGFYETLSELYEGLDDEVFPPSEEYIFDIEKELEVKER